MPPPPASNYTHKHEHKHTVPNNKKRAVFVASGRGKRPVAVRRQSSQSSTDSSARGADQQLQSSAERTPPQFGEQARMRANQRVQPPSHDNSSSSSSQASRRRPVSKLNEAKQHSSRRQGALDQSMLGEETSNQAGPSSKPQDSTSGHEQSEELTSEELDEIEVQRLLLAQANTRVQQRPQDTSHDLSVSPTSQVAQPSSSSGQYAPTTERSNGQYPSAQPQITSEGVNASTLPTRIAGSVHQTGISTSQTEGFDIGKGREPQSDLFAKRPVQPSTSVPDSGPLSRSKSQLTLLLERDRENNKKSNSSIDLKGKRKS